MPKQIDKFIVAEIFPKINPGALYLSGWKMISGKG